MTLYDPHLIYIVPLALHNPLCNNTHSGAQEITVLNNTFTFAPHNKMNYQLVIDKLQPGKIYTRRELINLISPTQSTTAEYILSDLVCAGRLDRIALGVNYGFRLNQ